MSVTRRYNFDWISGLPGLEAVLDGAEGLVAEDLATEPWLSSIQAWTAYIQAAVATQDVALGLCARQFPLRALPAGLRIMSSAADLSEAIVLMKTFARLADLPWRLDFRSDRDNCQISFSLEGPDHPHLADLEVLLLGFFMASLNWVIGAKIPYGSVYTRSSGFLARHDAHPDFGCAVKAASWTGVCLPAACLTSPCAKDDVEESVTEALIWLVYDHPEQMILPNQDKLESGLDLLNLRVENLPVYSEVGARQKRRNLLLETGLTLRDLKQRFMIRRAKILLINPSRCISDIAIELGYSDEASFRRFFKNFTGASPKEFRTSEECSVLQELSTLTHAASEISI